MTDFAALCLAPIWTILAVPARLTLQDGRGFDLTGIDETSGVTVTADKTEVPTVGPAAAIQYAQLVSLGLNADDIIRGTLTFNGFTWTIENHKLDPNPSGERSGEVLAMLINQSEIASSES